MSVSEMSSFGWSVLVSRRRSQFRVKASSFLVPTDEGMKKSSKISYLPSSFPRKTVGIIGGTSVFSTLVFVEKIAWWSSKQGKEIIPFVLCSDPELNTELSVYDPLTMNDSMLRIDSDRIVDNLRAKKEFLERAGAGCVVIPCYLLHAWHDEVAKGSRVPVLHAGECVARELQRANLRPIEAGSNRRVGILGTNAILRAGVYQGKLEKQGFEAVLPDRATMEHIVIPAIEALQKKDKEGAQNLLRIAIQVLLVRAVNVVILASEEMQGLLPRDDPLLKKCVDPMDALARSTVEWSRSQGKQTV